MPEINPALISELVRVTEATVQLWEGTQVSAVAAHNVYNRACQALRTLSEDEGFKGWLQTAVHEQGPNHQEDVQKIIGSLDVYLYFLGVEKVILIEAGMRPQTADILLHHLMLFRKMISVDGTITSSDYNSVTEELKNAASAVCEAATEVKAAAHRHRRWVCIRRLGLEFGGWTIIGANGLSFIPDLIATSGLSLLFGGGISVASAAAGKVLVSASKGVSD